MGNHFDQSLLNKQRKDKFVLTIDLPPALKSINSSQVRKNSNVNLDTLQMSIYGTIVPKNNIPQEEVRYAGSTVYVSSHNKPSYDPVSVNFTVDNEFKNYWVIHKWMELLRTERGGYYEYPEDVNNAGLGQYSSDFMVTAKDEYHNDVIQWVYKSAFPVGLGEINWNYRDGGELETTFEFAFRRIETILLPL
jgi:hypothetical protein